MILFFWLGRTGNVSQQFSLFQEAKKADVFAHTSTHTLFCWLDYSVFERGALLCLWVGPDDPVRLSAQRRMRHWGWQTHTHTHTHTEDGHRCVSGKEMVTRLAGAENVARYLGNFNLICSRSCASIAVCLLVLCENRECSQACLRKSSDCKTCVWEHWRAWDCCGDFEKCMWLNVILKGIVGLKIQILLLVHPCC